MFVRKYLEIKTIVAELWSCQMMDRIGLHVNALAISCTGHEKAKTNKIP